MFIRTLFGLGAMSVLICGLISCAPKDKQTRDVYRAPAPIIHKGGQSIDLRGWDRVSKKDLDLQDSLDASNSGAKQIEVETRCRVGGTDSLHFTRQPAGRALSFVRLVPLELLGADLAQSPSSCTFQITLVNGVGSKHVFPPLQATLIDQRLGAATFEVAGAPVAQLRLRLKNLGDLRLRSPVSGSARIVCQDGWTEALEFRATRLLADFDFVKLHLFSERAPSVFEIRARQSCRAVIANDDGATAITSRFSLAFELPPLQVQMVPRFPGQPGAPIAALPTGPLELIYISVHNPSHATRVITLPSARIKAHAFLALGDSSVYSAPIPYTTLEVGGQVQVTSEGAQYRVQIGPKATAEVHIMLRAPPIACTQYGSHKILIESPVPWAVVQTMGTLSFTEFAQDNEVLGQQALSLENLSYFGTDRNTRHLERRELRSGCNWD